MIFASKFILKFWGSLRPIWPQESHIRSISSNNNYTIAFWPWFILNMVLVLLSKRRDFTENFCLSDFVMFDNEFYYKMCLEYQKQSQNSCWTKWEEFWTTNEIIFCYFCYVCYEMPVMKIMLFFSDFLVWNEMSGYMENKYTIFFLVHMLFLS